MEIHSKMFRWAMSFRYLKKMHQAYSVWKDFTVGEREELIRAGGLDITSRILEDIGHPEMAVILRQERDAYVQKIASEVPIRKRRPRRTREDSDPKPYRPDAQRGVDRWAAAS